MNSQQYEHGGLLPIQSTNILRLISELEGSYQLLKYHAFDMILLIHLLVLVC